MLETGCHLSSAKGFLAMRKDAVSIEADTFQFFTHNPRGSKAKETDPADAATLRELAQRKGISNIPVHAPYTLSAYSTDPKTREFALFVMQGDLQRMEYLPSSYYNLYPGSHTGRGEDAGISQIAQLLDGILRPEQTTTVLLETMAKKGAGVGGSFSQLRRILDQVSLTEKVGVCLDTCHVYDAGYDLVSNLDDVLAQFDQEIGLSWLRAIHLNDSISPFFSHKNRHQKIRQGSLGLATMERIINYPALRELPFYLGTPSELPGYVQGIRLLKSLYRKSI